MAPTQQCLRPHRYLRRYDWIPLSRREGLLPAGLRLGWPPDRAAQGAREKNARVGGKRVRCWVGDSNEEKRANAYDMFCSTKTAPSNRACLCDVMVCFCTSRPARRSRPGRGVSPWRGETGVTPTRLGPVPTVKRGVSGPGDTGGSNR